MPITPLQHKSTLLSVDAVATFLVCLGTLLLGANIYLSIVTQSNLNQVAGVWTSLAYDLNHGIFYRPLFDEAIGTGGTRYFPLFFSLQALLYQLVPNYLLAGYMIIFASASFLFITVYRVLRRQGTPRRSILLWLLILLGTRCVLDDLTNIRVDILPLFLNLLGVYLYLRPRHQLTAPIAALCFTLAFASKFTALNGVAAVVVWLALNGEFKKSLQLAAYTFCGFLAVLALIHLASPAGMVEVFANTATGGGSLYQLVKAPFTFISMLAHRAPVSFVLFFWAGVTICTDPRPFDPTLEKLFFLWTALMTILLVSSPGVDVNHLIDLSVASVIVIGISYGKNRPDAARARTAAPLFLLSLIIILNAPPLYGQIKRHVAGQKRFPAELIEVVSQKSAVIAEDPLVAILAHKPPYISDPFMLRLVLQSNPPIKTRLAEAVRQKQFDAIVLMCGGERDCEHWYGNIHFGSEFMGTVYNHYAETRIFGRFYLYEPKSE